MDNNSRIVIGNEEAFSSFSHSSVSAKDLEGCGYKESRVPVMSYLIRKNGILKVILWLMVSYFSCAKNYFFKV